MTPCFMLCLGTSRFGFIWATVMSAHWQLLPLTIVSNPVGSSMPPSKRKLDAVANRCLQCLVCLVRFNNAVRVLDRHCHCILCKPSLFHFHRTDITVALIEPACFRIFTLTIVLQSCRNSWKHDPHNGSKTLEKLRKWPHVKWQPEKLLKRGLLVCAVTVTLR